MQDAAKYSITVRRKIVEGDDMWQATVLELPDVVVFAESSQDAYEQASAAVADLMAIAKRDGLPFPEPHEETEYSGRVTLRMPPSLHAVLARHASADDTSLNQYIVALLAASASSAVRAGREAMWAGTISSSVGITTGLRGVSLTPKSYWISPIFGSKPDDASRHQTWHESIIATMKPGGKVSPGPGFFEEFSQVAAKKVTSGFGKTVAVGNLEKVYA